MNFSNLINQFISSPSSPSSSSPVSEDSKKTSGLNMGSLATGAALGGAAGFLANSSTGRRYGRKAMRAGRTAAGLGGLALVGGLAYKAFTNHKKQSSGETDQDGSAPIALPPTDSAFNPKNTSVDQSKLGLIVLRAMIAAASSDGEIDKDEQAKIFGQMNDSQLSQEEQDFLMAEMKNPLSANELARQSTSEEMALQVYSAAFMAIEVDTPEEEKFMFDLRAGLKINNDLANEIEKEVKHV